MDRIRQQTAANKAAGYPSSWTLKQCAKHDASEERAAKDELSGKRHRAERESCVVALSVHPSDDDDWIWSERRCAQRAAREERMRALVPSSCRCHRCLQRQASQVKSRFTPRGYIEQGATWTTGPARGAAGEGVGASGALA